MLPRTSPGGPAFLLLYYSLLQVWPRQGRYLRWAGVLTLVYPGYLQQSISGAYNRHFMAFLVFAVSVYLMALSTRKVRLAWLLAAGFMGGDLHPLVHHRVLRRLGIRPTCAPLAAGLEPGSSDSRPGHPQDRLACVAVSVDPCLVFLVAVGDLSVNHPDRANYAGDFKLLQDFDISLLSGVLAVLTRAFLDLVHATLQVWLSFLTDPDAWTLQAKISWLAWGLGAVLALIFWRVGDSGAPRDAPDSKPPASMLWFGVVGILRQRAAHLAHQQTAQRLGALGRSLCPCAHAPGLRNFDLPRLAG